MPLHDHFHPTWSLRRPWEGFHGAWATSIAFHLNSGVLPEVWPEVLTIGSPLPELPLWLEIDLSVRLALEESYAVTCGSLRMRG